MYAFDESLGSFDRIPDRSLYHAAKVNAVQFVNSSSICQVPVRIDCLSIAKKESHLIRSLRTLTSCVFTMTVLDVYAGDGEDAKLAALLGKLEKLHLVTKTPHEMADSTAVLCRPAIELPHKIRDGFRKSAFCNVYVNSVARDTMLSGRGDTQLAR